MPPGETVSGSFEPDTEQIELILLHNNPNRPPEDGNIIFDTRAKKFTPSKISG